MAPRADLTGVHVQGWTVSHKAPAQNRVAFWCATHDECGTLADIPHVTLTKAVAGKATLPACTTCVPAEDRRGIEAGMHLACGQSHLIGTPCPVAVELPQGFRDHFGLKGDYVAAPPAVPTYTGHPADHEPTSRYQKALKEKTAFWAQFDETDIEEPTPVELPQGFRDHFGLKGDYVAAPPAAFVETTIGAAPGTGVVHGRVDRLDEPQDVLDVIRRAIIEAPRSQQEALGPSEYGGCERKLGHRLALGKSERDADGAWRPQVGTAVHAWLADVFGAVFGGNGRWLSDFAVTSPVAGTLDLFDRDTGRVIDFKVSGETVRNKAAKGEVSDRYETQLDLYGLGMLAAGYHVESVALLFLPPAGSLSEAVWYSRPFNPARAVASIERHNRVKALLAVRPFEEVLARLEATEDYCSGCPALGKYCKGAETAWIPGGLPDSAWPAYDAAVKALGGAA